MRYFQAFKSLCNLRTLLVALIFAGIIYYYYSHKDWAAEVRVSQDKRIDLLAALDQVELMDGFDQWPGGLDFYANPKINTDSADLFLSVPADSAFKYKSILIYKNAFLRVGYGILESQGDPPFGPVTFEVELQTKDRCQQLLSRSITPRDTGRLFQFEYQECSLKDWDDEKCTLIFRCKTDQSADASRLICGWGNLKIDSEGRRAALKNIKYNKYKVEYDFLADSKIPAAKQGARTYTWAMIPGGRDYTLKGPWIIEESFSPYLSQPGRAWNGLPALVFIEGASIDFPDLVVPDKDQVSLQFYTGLKAVACAAGGACFSVSIDGRELYSETVEGGGLSDQWRERLIDLSDFRGRRVGVSFSVKFPPAQPKEVSLPTTKTGAHKEKDRLREVQRSVAAFGRPRLRSSTEIGRSFSSKRNELNLVLINVDGLVSRYLGCYGSPQGLTPCLDRLGDSGLIFLDAVSCAPSAFPSVATLFTGLYPLHLGVGKTSARYLKDRHITLAEFLQRHRITTAAFVAGQGVDRYSNVDQGFETFVTLPMQNARKVNALFNDWLIARGAFRFFAYIHYTDPQWPFNAPSGLKNRHVPRELRDLESAQRIMNSFATRHDRNRSTDALTNEEIEWLKGRYFGEIAYLDRRIEELLKLLSDHKVLDKTLIVFTASHGQEFMEHGALGHGAHLYEESIRVPLIIWGPEEIVGTHRIVEGMVDQASIFSTVAALLAFPLDGCVPELMGAPLVPIDEQFSHIERFAFSETCPSYLPFQESSLPAQESGRAETLRAVMNWHFKLISNGDTHTLYDLVEDPDEKHDLAGAGLPEEELLLRKLATVQKKADHH